MLLAIDVGNTNTVLGVFDGETLVEHWRIATVPDRTADEIFVVMRGLIALSAAVKDADIAGISLCSTVPSVLHELREMCARYYADRTTIIVEPGVKTGVPIRYDNPKEVGSDRIMNALAAVHLYGGPAIVVDFGTSTNFDAVSAHGEFVGGALAPGIEVSVEALARRAAQLLKVELSRPPHVIGKSTVDALRSGMLYGFAGQVEGIARRMRDELAPDNPDGVTVIATGGLAPLIINEVPLITAHEPWLTLIGLRLVYERNAQDLFGSLWAWLKKISRSRSVSGLASEKGCSSPAPKRIPSGSSGRRPRRNCAPNTGHFRPIRPPVRWRASPGG